MISKYLNNSFFSVVFPIFPLFKLGIILANKINFKIVTWKYKAQLILNIYTKMYIIQSVDGK